VTTEEIIDAQHQARMSLVQCAQYIRERDMLIKRAALLGIPRAEIARILGMSRTYVSEIAKRGIA
jgi:DNA-binding CsgD family transcriptional regulator